MNDFRRKIEMLCPICGNTQLETEEEGFDDLADAPDDAEFRCMDCGATCTKQELIEENSELIHNTFQELKSEIEAELVREWRRMMRK